MAMERDLWTLPEVRRAAAPLVPLRLDLSSPGPESDGLLAIFSVDSVPAVLVIDDRGRELDRVEGLPTAAAVLAMLQSLEGPRSPRP